MPKIVKPDERRQFVVEAAYRVIARDGVEGFTIRNVAKEAGGTIGLVTRWFKSKEELIEAAVDRAVTDFDVEIEKALKAHEDVPMRVLEMAMPLTEDGKAEYRIWLAFWALSICRTNLRTSYQSYYATYREMLTSFLQRKYDMGGEASEIADLFLIFLDGIGLQTILDEDRWTPEYQSKLFWRLVKALT